MHITVHRTFVFDFSFLLLFKRIATCSRWDELGETLKFHAQAAHVAAAPTEFRLLNGERAK